MLTVNEVWERLGELGLHTNIQTIRYWIREGKLEGLKESNAVGYLVTVESFEKLVEQKLKTKNKRHLVYQDGYNKGFSDAKKLYQGKEELGGMLND